MGLSLPGEVLVYVGCPKLPELPTLCSFLRLGDSVLSTLKTVPVKTVNDVASVKCSKCVGPCLPFCPYLLSYIPLPLPAVFTLF